MQVRSLSPRHADAPLVPVIGMGTSKTLDTKNVDAARPVVDAALDAGTTVFDTSPMYGRAERTLATCLADRRRQAVVATKVWTPDDVIAEQQIAESLDCYGGHIELLQIHNMVGWRARLDRLEALRDEGLIDLIGATHWRVDAFDVLEECMATGRIDTIQVPYNPGERDVERRILPLAVELGLGVVLMRPFAEAELLRPPPPADALAPLAELGITTWSQALLAWGLAHPAVSVSIPATSHPSRAADNATAGNIPPLDAAICRYIADRFAP